MPKIIKSEHGGCRSRPIVGRSSIARGEAGNGTPACEIPSVTFSLVHAPHLIIGLSPKHSRGGDDGPLHLRQPRGAADAGANDVTSVRGSICSRPTRASRCAAAGHNRLVSVAAGDDVEPSPDGARYTLAYGRYRLAYEVYGSGDRVLVWLHGLLLDASLSRGLARALAARGNRVVLLDFLGHGRSDKPRHSGAHRMDLYAEQVLYLLDELGVDQVVLGGVSMGTNVSLMATVAAPEGSAA